MPPALRWLLAAASFGFVVVQLDVTIVNVALPRIGADLHTGVAGLQWIVDAYTLAFAVLLLSAGILGDKFGSKRAYLAGFALFFVSSLACGVAVSGSMLVAARAFQGLGAALLVPSSLALINHAFGHDRRLRARAIGIWTACSALGIASGPVIGACLLQLFGWRSIFFVNLPLCLIGAWLTRRAVPGREPGAANHPLDPVGQILAIVFLTSLVGAVIEFRPLGGGHPVVIGGFIAALASGAIFVVAESRARAPMLPLDFFKLPNFSVATAFGVLVNITYYGVIFVISLYLQQVRGFSVMATGLAYLPLTATFIVSNLTSGYVADRAGARRLMVIGALLGLTGFALLSRLGPDSSFAAMLPPFMIIPFGMGLAVPAMTSAVLAAAPSDRSGAASAVLNTARQSGGAIGVAIFGALASGGPAQVTIGLHRAALISVGLLGAAVILGSLMRVTVPVAGDLVKDRAAG